MATRQYIGARYIPRFMGTYDNTQAYEALDVTDNGLGTSYIAKKPTPPGTPFSNTDYWALYGSSSGAVIDLQNQINDLKDVVVFHFDTVSDMKVATLADGNIAITKGFNSVGDGGGAHYYITSVGVANELNIIACGDVNAVLLDRATTANLGKVANDFIDDILALNIEFDLSYDQKVNINDDSVLDWTNAVCIDNVTFNGHYIINTGTHYRATVYVTKNKSDINIKDLWLRFNDVDDLIVSNINIRNFNKSGGCIQLWKCNNIILNDLNVQSGYYVSGVHTNGDGLYIGGDCHNITVNNGYFWCSDDALAIVADDSDHLFDGDVSDIYFNNIMCEQNSNYNGINIQNSAQNVWNVYVDNSSFFGKFGPTVQIVPISTEPFTGTLGNINFTNCFFKNETSDGTYQKRNVRAYNTEGLSFRGFTFFANSTSAEEITVIDTNVSIVDCTFNLNNKTVRTNAISTENGNAIIENVRFIEVNEPPRYIYLVGTEDYAIVDKVTIGGVDGTAHGIIIRGSSASVSVSNVKGGTANNITVGLYDFTGKLSLENIDRPTGTILNVSKMTASACRFIKGVIYDSDASTYEVGDSWYKYDSGTATLTQRFCDTSGHIASMATS